MKISSAARFSLLAILLLIAVLMAGCQTAPPVDWKSRVGTYTIEQAVKELGPPDKRFKLGDGKIMAQWITVYQRPFAPITGNYRDNIALGVGPNTGLDSSESVLQLIFGADGKLASWSKN
jgi:hypothetical protein